MKFAVIRHPDSLEQLRRYYPILRRFPDGLLNSLACYLPPVKVGTLQSKAGDSGVIIACPLLPGHFSSLSSGYRDQKIRSCLQRAEKFGAQIIGLEGLTAFFSQEGQGGFKLGRAILSRGVGVRSWQVLHEARLLTQRKGLSWSQVRVVLVGAAGQEGRSWAELLARENRSLTLLQPRFANEQQLANRIIYETGVALKISTQPQQVLRDADLVFLYGSKDELILEPTWFKNEAIVCTIFPNSGWESMSQFRKDLAFLPKLKLQVPSDLLHSEECELSNGVSAALAETIIMVMEKKNACSGYVRDITIRQVEAMGILTKRHGLCSYLESIPLAQKGSGPLLNLDK